MIKVLLIGPSINRTKGGIATVINDLKSSNNEDNAIEYRHIISHVEGNKLEKAWVGAMALIKVMLTRKYDIMHIHVATDASFFRKSLFVLLAYLFQKKVIMHVHGAGFDSFFNNSLAFVQWYIRKIFALCSKTLVLSDYWKSFFTKNIIDKNVEVLLNGVYAEDFKRCNTVPENLFRFLFLGRLGQRKGIYDLLKAIDILVNKRYYTDIFFYLAGDGDINQVKKIIEAKGLQKNVQLLGWVGDDDKLEYLQKADTMILPSYNEGLPMSILESMAAGKIIISSRVGGIPDLVTEHENGYLINPGDVEGLCNYIIKVISHPEEMAVISDRNIKKIKETYDLPKIHAQLFEMYYSIMNKKYTKKIAKYSFSAVQPLD
jgi:glycosyltransferase involved in cell wall biosynthesis